LLNVEQEWVSVAVAFETKEGLARLRSQFGHRKTPAADQLLTLLKESDARFKTKLQKKTEKPGAVSYSEVKSVISCKIDQFAFTRLIIEADAVKQEDGKEGRATASLSLLHLMIPLDQALLERNLPTVKRVYDLARSLNASSAPLPKLVSFTKTDSGGYRQYIEMLNDARSQDIVSAEQRRDLDRRWRENPGDRPELVEDLTRLLKKQLRK
jgi:hypothetical protein